MSHEPRTIEVKVFRFSPSVDREPRYETYRIPFVEGRSVSNVLQNIQGKYNGVLAHYLSCRRGICAGCMVQVNRKVVLAGTEMVRGDLVIEPVHRDRIIKDLVMRPARREDGPAD